MQPSGSSVHCTVTLPHCSCTATLLYCSLHCIMHFTLNCTENRTSRCCTTLHTSLPTEHHTVHHSALNFKLHCSFYYTVTCTKQCPTCWTQQWTVHTAASTAQYVLPTLWCRPGSMSSHHRDQIVDPGLCPTVFRCSCRTQLPQISCLQGIFSG